MTNASVALAVESFFAWRIYSLTTDRKIKEWFSLSVEAKLLVALPFVIFLLALLQFAAAVAMTVEYIRIGRRVQDVSRVMTPIVVHLSSQLACDVLITLGMVLAKLRTATRIKRTKSMLNKLVIHTVENGLITTLCATGNLVMCLVARTMSNTVSVAFHYVFAILYGIVLLTTLNRRQNYRQIDNGDVTLELNLPPTDMLDSTLNTEESQAVKSQELSSSIASLKATEDDPVTSPYHLILYERISKLQVLIKKVQRIFGNSPPDGYTPDAEERKEVEALKKEMLELIGTPEPLAEREASSRRESNRTSMLTVVGTPEPGSSAREEALRREQLVQIHSLITLLAPPASGSTEQDASTFESLEECIDALLRSLESVPIPTPTPSISGEHETTEGNYPLPIMYDLERDFC
ncbi:hypothetical protein MD484_g7283, partial [Candolleomyces efflorescens]